MVKMKKAAFCLIVIVTVLLVASQVLAQLQHDTIPANVKNVTITCHPHSMQIKHEGGEDCISMEAITSIRFLKSHRRISITIYRGPTLHYDFDEDYAARAKQVYIKMIQGVFKEKR